MNKNVVDFFKRNPDAKAAHLVHDKVFEKIEKASRYQKFHNAKKISSFTKKEFDDHIKEVKKQEKVSQPPASEQN